MSARRDTARKEGSMVDSLSIRSWDDWFRACGDAVGPASRYEEAVLEWHKLREEDTVSAERAYARRHDRHFWEDESVFHPKMVKRMLLCGIVGLVVGMVAGVLFGLFLAERGLDVAGAAPFGVLGLAVGLLAGFLPMFLKARSLQKRMAKLEPSLAQVMRYIPPKYRNSWNCEAFADMWASYGIASFDRAIDVADEHIRNNASNYKPVQILFDVKYSSTQAPDGSFVSDDDESKGTGGPDLSAPGLPSDIESHIHEGVEDSEEALARLIGMDAVKTQVRRLRNRVEFSGESGGEGAENFVFLGGAGSGKTVVARIITRILYDFGYIRENRIMEVDGDYLKSPYVGQTGERVNAIVTAAKGGVLFIDEAYLLYNEKDSNSVGQEAIGVLLKAMEDERDDLVVILAGYEDGMNRLLASNEGFSSRVKHKFYFPDYTACELGEIFKLFMEQSTGKVRSIHKDAYEALVEHFDSERGMPGFGNARAARNAFDKLVDVHADRYVEGEVDEKDKFSITMEDVAAFVAAERTRLASDGRNFMATSHLDEKIVSLSELKTRTHEGAEDPDAEMAAMVGLDAVKDEMQAYLRRSAFFKGAEDAQESAGNLNMVLTGPPGTGKSSLVRIITGYLYKAGYIRENRYVDVTGDFLKAPYVGQTGKRTEAVVEYAKGMLLFIDEAYLLGKSSGTGSDFGAEAVGVLVNAMEKSQGKLVVAFAGYGPEMNAFLDLNPGLRSRIGTVFELPAYTGKELMSIFQSIANKRGFACDKAMAPTLARAVKKEMASPGFGNARSIRQLVEKCVNRHVDRYAAGEIGEDRRMVLDSGDVSWVLEDGD